MVPGLLVVTAVEVRRPAQTVSFSLRQPNDHVPLSTTSAVAYLESFGSGFCLSLTVYCCLSFLIPSIAPHAAVSDSDDDSPCVAFDPTSPHTLYSYYHRPG